MDESVLSVGTKGKPPQDSTLQYFLAEINLKNGKDYESSSLVAMQSSTDKYLREPNYEYSILNILYWTFKHILY